MQSRVRIEMAWMICLMSFYYVFTCVSSSLKQKLSELMMGRIESYVTRPLAGSMESSREQSSHCHLADAISHLFMEVNLSLFTARSCSGTIFPSFFRYAYLLDAASYPWSRFQLDDCFIDIIEITSTNYETLGTAHALYYTL